MTHDLPDTAPIAAGGRVDMRLESTGDGEVVYGARWFVEEDSPVSGQVRLTKSPGKAPTEGSPARTVWAVEITSESALPEWLDQFTSNLLRTLARGAPPWPRRITRWRDER